MPKKELTLPALLDLDYGIIGAQFAHKLKQLVEDGNDLPNGEKRVLTMSLNLVPETVAGREVKWKVEAEFKGAVPIRRSKTFVMDTDDDNKLWFNPEVSDNPDQTTISDEVARKERERLRLANHG